MSTEVVEHAHAFARDMTGLCRCGMTAEQYQRLRTDEAAGRPHSAETTKPVDQHGRAVDEPVVIAGAVIITWPSSKTFKGFVPAAGLIVTDVESGENILTITDLRIVIGFNTTEMAIVELTTLADSDGAPVLFATSAEQNRRIALDDAGNIRTATTWWHVAEMRVSP